MNRIFRFQLFALSLLTLMVCVSCTSMTKKTGARNQVHGGIRYTLHEDSRFSRVEKGKDGSLMYDSPELTVHSDQGRLKVNGVDVGPVKPGDHVQVTDSQMVLVNGQHRGDNTTGSAENKKRLAASKIEVMR